MNVFNSKWRRLDRWQVCQLDYPRVHGMNNWQLCLSNSANSNATNDSNCAIPKEQNELQQSLANVPEWVSKLSCNEKWQLCQNWKRNQLEQPLANVPKWLSDISFNNHWQVCQSDWVKNIERQQSNETGTMCPPWKTASFSNWDAVGPSRDWVISCKSQKYTNPFSFLSKITATLVNQQMCQSTNLILNKKGPFALQQSTINVNQQMCQLTV